MYSPGSGILFTFTDIYDILETKLDVKLKAHDTDIKRGISCRKIG